MGKKRSTLRNATTVNIYFYDVEWKRFLCIAKLFVNQKTDLDQLNAEVIHISNHFMDCHNQREEGLGDIYIR